MTSAADTPPIVALATDACEREDAAAIARVLAIELRATVTTNGDAGHDETKVRLRCGAPASVEVDDPVTMKLSRREVDLGPTATASVAARARLLGLAAAELVRWSWSELAVPRSETASGPTASRAAVTAVARAVERDARWTSLAVLADARWFPAGLATIGGALETRVRVRGRVAAAVDVAGGGGKRTQTDREISAVAVSLAPRVDVEALPATTLSAGWRVGYAALAGTTRDAAAGKLEGRQAAGLWSGPFARATLRAHVGRHAIVVGAELGYAPIGFRATSPDEAAVRMAAWWTAAQLGWELPL